MGVGFIFGILGFAKKYWKFFAIAAVLIGLFILHQNAVAEYGNKRFQEGVTATTGKVKAQIAQKNRENRELEAKLEDALTDHAAELDAINNKRGKKESALAESAMEKVNKIPFIDNAQCAVTPEVLNDRNAIRRLGPSL